MKNLFNFLGKSPVMIILSVLLLSLPVSALGTLPWAYAEESKVDKEHDLNNFLSMAINPQVHFPASLTLYSPEGKVSRERIKRLYPWLAPFVFNDGNSPRPNVINKWNKPIQISIGYPDDFKVPDEAPIAEDPTTLWPTFSSADEANDPDKKKIVMDEIGRVTPDLSHITNLPIQYRGREQEIKESLSNIRIILLDKNFRDNKYKPDVYMPGMHTYMGTRNFFDAFVNRYLYGVVFFSPASKQQVYGYIFPDGKNNIQMSFCYIWNGHGEDILRSLVDECLLSSLGLTNRSEMNISKQPGVFSYQDKNFLNLLYTPQLKAGADFMEAYKTFQNR